MRQFKASVAPPQPGLFMDKVLTGNEVMNFNSMDDLIRQVKAGLEADQDDKFFHVTCHIDPALKAKIEKEEFIELEKLLPKTKTQMMADDKRLQFFYQNGETFFVPADKENKISSIRKWEQAFRVYAAIYCAANPSCSAEI